MVVGATVEEKGFDLTVQAGSVTDLFDDARRLVPALDEYEFCETTTGLRPGSPDNGPIVGPAGLPGLLVATGHYRNGILLAPVTADEVVRLLTAPAAPQRRNRRGRAVRRLQARPLRPPSRAGRRRGPARRRGGR